MLALGALVLLLAACGGEWTVSGSADADGAVFSRGFRYYYVQDCVFDSFGYMYDCSSVESVSPAYTATLRIDSDYFATLSLDGRYTYYYTEREYTSSSDDYGGYYRFYEDDWELTLYKSGTELIIWDLVEGIATIYSHELFY